MVGLGEIGGLDFIMAGRDTAKPKGREETIGVVTGYSGRGTASHVPRREKAALGVQKNYGDFRESRDRAGLRVAQTEDVEAGIEERET